VAKKPQPTAKPVQPEDAAAPSLRHVLVVGGTTREWDALGEELWAARRNELAKVVAHAGAMWLTIRPFAADPPGAVAECQRMVDVREGCTVVVDPAADGRARLLAAIEQLRGTDPAAVDEAAIAAVLMTPAPVEPDLTLVVGPPERLPPSLVWELAYSEIVPVDTTWSALSAAHVEHAIDEFSRRHRRFGGV
jgi:undecaprenyl diphosphate synthase